MEPSPPRPPPDFQALAEEYLERLQAGEDPDPEELAARYPEVSSEIRRRLSAVARVHRAARRLGSELNEGEPTPERHPERVGRFRILELLGKGGFGYVYLANDPDLDRPVAVKVPRSGMFLSTEEEKRFLREARSAARLQHPGIVRIHEVGHEEGIPYIVSELIEGRTLAERLSEGKIPFTDAADLAASVADALEHAHRQGVVHRDVKPGNILLDGEDLPHVSDFGLARGGGEDATMTVEGQILGTPAYMSPEQARGEHGAVSARSDVYSLGAVLYEALTGDRPFRGDRSALLLQVLNEEPRPPRALDPRIPVDLETVCLKAMAKEPARRYMTAGQFADDLRRWLRGEPVRARPAGNVERAWRWCRRKPLIASLTASVTALLVAVTAVSVVSAARLADRNREARESLWQAYLSQAQAERSGGRSGRRFRALEAIRKAAEIRPSLELRDEAIACLAIPDLRVKEGKDWSEPDRKGIQLAFDPPVERFAIDCSAPGTPIELRRVADGAMITRLRGDGNVVGGLRFSSDGRRVLGVLWRGNARTCVVWELESAQEIGSIGSLSTEASAGFSPDGRRVAVVLDSRAAAVHDFEAKAEVSRHSLPGKGEYVEFHPDGRMLAVTLPDSHAVLVLDLEGSRPGRRLDFYERMYWIAWNRTGSLLAVTSNDGRVHVVETAGWTIRSVLEGHQSTAVHVIFARTSDLLATASWDGTTRFWDPWNGSFILSAPGEAIGPFSPDDRRLGFIQASSRWGVWEVAPAAERRTLRRKGGYPIDFTSVAFSPDGRLLCSTSRTGLGLWDLSRFEESAFVPNGEQASVLFAPGAEALYVSGHGGVKGFPIESAGERLRVGPPFEFAAPRVAEQAALSRDGSRLAVVDMPGHRAVVHDLRKEREPVILGPHLHALFVSLSADGALAATSTWHGSEVKVWDTATGKLFRTLPVATSARSAFSRDGRWLVTAEPAEYRFWETAGWECAGRIPMEPEGNPGHAAFSDNGALVAITRDRSRIDLVDVSSRSILARLEAPGARVVTSLGFSADGLFLAAANRRDIDLWDLGSIREGLAGLGLDWAPRGTRSRPGPPPSALVIDVVAARSSEGPSPLIESQKASYRRVIELVSRYLGERPLDAHLYCLRGAHLALLEQWKEARSDLEKALELDPDNFFPRPWLAHVHANATGEDRDPSRAVALALASLEASPAREGVLSILGVACYRLGDLPGAMRALQESRAARDEFTDITNLFFLSMCHSRLGLRPLADHECREAERLLSISLRRDPVFESYRREARSLLEAAPTEK